MSYFNDDEDDNISEVGYDEENGEEEEYIPKKNLKNMINAKVKKIDFEKSDIKIDDSDSETELVEDDDEEEDDLNQYGGVVSDDEEEIDDEDDGEDGEDTIKKVKELPTNFIINNEEDDEEDEDDDGEVYLKKFDKDIQKNYIMNFHPECVIHNYDEIEIFTKVVRDKNGIIIDDLHKTIPYLTKYERTRVLGQRAKQINSGGTPFVKVPENVIDGYLIAELELQQKRIPFIIRRPLPNGGSEYWNIKDLDNIAF